MVYESTSRPLVNFDVLNDNLIRGLIFFVKYMSILYLESINIFIDISLGVQLWSK
jgi:hypothetical protein